MTIQLDGTSGISTNNISVSGQGYNTVVSLTDGSTINWDWSIQQSSDVTINGNRTLANPTNAVTGQYSALRVNRSGSYILSFGAGYKGLSNISQSTISGKIDHFVFRYNGTNYELVSFKADIGA
jgi:hypothetical protein